MRIVCVIPARLQSRRFPKKVLSRLGHKPMLQWIWDRAMSCQLFDDVAFAIDAGETAQLIESFGGKYFMTSPKCSSGTDRLIELMESRKLQGDIWVNWQGDEPLICREMVEDLLEKTGDVQFAIWSLKKRIEKVGEIDHPHVTKVVTDLKHSALYFSRSPIPYCRDHCSTTKTLYYKHIGIYAFRSKALVEMGKLPPSPLERAEQLEQLRFLQNGWKMAVYETPYETVGIDYPTDLVTALELSAKERKKCTR